MRFFEITSKQGGRGKGSMKQGRIHRSSFITYFSDPSHHDDHPHPLFQRLYLGLQPRYKPSATSALSPTSVSTDGCPPIIRLHCGFLLPWHETNFFVPPPHRSKHLLHEQPSFLSALLSNNSKKWPRRLGERKVSI